VTEWRPPLKGKFGAPALVGAVTSEQPLVGAVRESSSFVQISIQWADDRATTVPPTSVRFRHEESRQASASISPGGLAKRLIGFVDQPLQQFAVRPWESFDGGLKYIPAIYIFFNPTRIFAKGVCQILPKSRPCSTG